ncbi:ABC transporter permease [Pedobacter fastidiosus]|uniref:ABC transporter permease n=1 Tax=Pedobacter fastidiosus TaxID=2765361 RepID=A0ABR7KPI9_9SPHI|nr:ABC transporter permease [Pedobacter fastidiosus]MBC6110006.1 ABC transporter permease [Pedobacter fastidiosus]
MFKLNLKIAWRNLFKNKIYAAINIGGLALGLTAFVLMLLYINHEESYDSWSPDLKNVYQLREKHDQFTPDNKEHWNELANSKIAALLREKMPQIQAITKVSPNWDFVKGYSIKIAGADPIVVSKMTDSDSSFFKVFKYNFIHGNAESALNKPKSIVLKRDLALKLFGTEKVLGKTLKVMMWTSDPGQDLTITGVVTDPSTPQSVNFNALMRTGEKDSDPKGIGNTNYCELFAKLNEGQDTLALSKTLQYVYVDFKKALMSQQKINFKDVYKNGKTAGLKFVSIKDVHSNPPFQINWKEKLKPIIAIAIFLLLVSIINFINLATAQSVQRAKEVGVKKVLGAYKKQLITQFLLESSFQTIISLFLSVILIEIVLPGFNTQFNVELSFWHNPNLSSLIGQLFAVFIFVTLMAGFYPAYILSNYKPVSVLKGNYENGLSGLTLRNVLVVFQFVISVTFITAIGVMHKQTQYLNNKDLGFERSNLINIRTNYEDNLANRIMKIPGVTYVATTTQVMGNTFNVPEKIKYKGNDINLNTVSVTMDALPALGVRIILGRIFSRDYKQDTVNAVVLNEAAAKLISKNPIGEKYEVFNGSKNVSFQIIGVIKNYHNEGFNNQVLPTLYKVTNLGGAATTNNLLVRFNTSANSDIIKKIKKEWSILYPNYPMDYTSLDDEFTKILDENSRFMNMIILFSIISVSLSLLGLFALSTFVAKRRTKEIAVRKVLGASNLQIVNMLNKSFLILVISANLISWPIAYIIIKKWLDGFAYRIEMPFFPFIMATLISIVIAVLTVSIQARKAAVTDPVNALKYE